MNNRTLTAAQVVRWRELNARQGLIIRERMDGAGVDCPTDIALCFWLTKLSPEDAARMFVEHFADCTSGAQVNARARDLDLPQPTRSVVGHA